MAMDFGGRTGGGPAAGADWRGPVDMRPDRSARRRLTYAQMAVLTVFIAAGGWLALRQPRLAFEIAHWSLFGFFAAVLAFRLCAALYGLVRRPRAPAPGEGPTPPFTLLCPLYREASVAPQLVRALERLDYPLEALQILLLVEGDDFETLAALTGMRLGAPFEIILIPAEGPRTKPKALNIGLAHARGTFCAIYDAEDRPSPEQLRAAVAAFAADDGALACVQAPLVPDNGRERWIASQFAAEYALHFGVTLPFLARLDLPLPLGGTSNHFRVAALRAVGGWDPYNVTEDADLGYRLACYGWRAGVIDSPTWEEAPVRMSAWMRQRTRWIKGHLQTWAVLMRNPVRTITEMGLPAFLSLQLTLFAAVAAALLHAPMLALVGLSLAARFGVETPYLALAPISVADLALLAAGYATAFSGALVAAARMGSLRLVAAIFTMPLYWPLATIAAWRALADFVWRPHYWSKTQHGQSRGRAPARMLAEADLRARADARDVRALREARARNARRDRGQGSGSIRQRW